MESLPLEEASWQVYAHATNPKSEIGKIKTFYLREEDRITALKRGFGDPSEVVNARIVGDSEGTHDIALVVVWSLDGPGLPAGSTFACNAAELMIHLGYPIGVYAPSQEAAEEYDRIGATAKGLCRSPMFWSMPVGGATVRTELSTDNAVRRDNLWRNPDDYTSFMPGQADWTPDDPPSAARILEPQCAYCTTDQYMTSTTGEPMRGVNGNPLRAFDHVLPLRISLEVEPWVVGPWVTMDPRITAKDIVDRFGCVLNPTQTEAASSLLDTKVCSWRFSRKIMKPLPYPQTDELDRDVVAGLSESQLMFNTSWELSNNRSMVRKPSEVPIAGAAWYNTPFTHLSYPSDYDRLHIGPTFSPRVAEALRKRLSILKALDVRAGGQDGADVTYLKGEQSATDQQAHEDETVCEEQDILCPVCTKGDGGTWVQCDGTCTSWFHVGCAGQAGYSEAELQVRSFYCVACERVGLGKTGWSKEGHGVEDSA